MLQEVKFLLVAPDPDLPTPGGLLEAFLHGVTNTNFSRLVRHRKEQKHLELGLTVPALERTFAVQQTLDARSGHAAEPESW